MVWSIVVASLGGCRADLPPGWEDAVPVEELVQRECSGSPYDTGLSSDVTADLEAEPLEVDAAAVPFRCAQDVEGFWMQAATRVDVLVQPRDMHPRAVAGCDCLYDLEITVGSPDPYATQVVLWRRWDAINEPNDPVEVGRVP